MAVKTSSARAWRSLLQRGLDTAAELSASVAQKISAAADPRARLLRRRRRALRWGLIFAGGCLVLGVVTALLAAWGWFALLLEITGVHRGREAIPATLLLFRYRWLRVRAAAGAAAGQASAGCPRPVRPRDPRCTRWELPNAASSRCWA